MRILIHRGSGEIGGTCIELSTNNTKILLDIGQPLSSESRKLDYYSLKPNAVIISHPHQDHYGLIDAIDSNVTIYSGELCKKLIDATYIFLEKKLPQNDFKHFKSREPFEIGDFTINPFLVDHSSVDAYAFLVETEGKRIFYSGDFRAHGRKSILFKNIFKNPPKNIDVLFMEGTMLSRSNEELPDEHIVEESILEVLEKESGPCFLLCSSQNIDRLVSAYRASKRASRIFVIEIYTAWILKELSQYSNRTPTIEWKDIRVLSKGRTAKNHYIRVKDNPDYFEGFIYELYKKDNVITQEEITKEPQKYFIKNSYVEYLFNKLRCSQASVIYSMWRGYLKKEYNPSGYKKLRELQNNPKINFVYIHSSGHAFIKDLQRFATALKPKILIPIHTEHPDDFKEYFENVFLLEDGKELIL
jgi:ribonuclease J